MTQATPKDYWISPSALHIELNALSNPDYIQASCVSGAQILVYVKDIIGYDAGHNYRRWPLQAAPTVFNSHAEKYVYAAIPRDMTLAASAWIVFPSEVIDIYGKNAAEEQIGNEKYYYINLQGVITSSGDNGTVQRDWKQRIATGYLSSDEAISAVGNETEWYNYSNVDGIVTFLKDITMKEGTKFQKLFANFINVTPQGSLSFDGQGAVTGIADSLSTPDTSTDKIVTPDFVRNRAISKLHDDTAEGVITFKKGLKATSVEAGRVTADSMKATSVEAGSVNADSMTTRNLEVTGAAHFFELMIDKVRSVGGRVLLTCASCEAMYVEMIDVDGAVVEEYGEGVKAFRVYFLAEDDRASSVNGFEAGDYAICQSFNRGAGSMENVSNRYYWRRVTGCSYEAGQYSFDTGGNKYYWIELSNAVAHTDPYSNAIPAIGDSIVQLGNSTKVERASAMVLSAYNDGWLDADIKAPSFAQYERVCMDAKNRWRLSSCRTTYFSREKNEIIGDLKALTEGGAVNVGSTMEEFARLTSENIEFWFYDYAPTLDNAPAAEWIEQGTADSHVGDIFYDTTRSGSFTGGTTYKFIKTGENLYSWEPVTDAQTLKSLQLIADAADDGIISGGSELSRLFLSWKEQQQKYVSIKAQSEQCDELATLTLAWLTMCRMLNDDVVLQDADNGTPSYFSDLSRDIILSEHTINGETLTPDKYRGYWNAYYTAYANLEKAITSDVKTKITAANGQISMVVEGLKKTGVHIEDGKILLSADNTEVDGNLKLRGVIIENYESTEDELIICDLVQHKSVSVNSHSQVLLPMLQDVQIQRVHGGTLTAHSVAGVNVSGLKLTISAKYNPDVAKWATGARSLYTESVMEQFHSKAVVVFADPRLASSGNYTYNEEFATSIAEVNPLGGGGYTAAGYRGGVFVCNGRRGRMLLLMPGQTLKLTSAVETIGGEDVLLWYVDNPEGFTPIDKIVRFVAPQTEGAEVTYDVTFTTYGGSLWPSEPWGSSGSEYEESLFAPAQISASYPETQSEVILEIDLY